MNKKAKKEELNLKKKVIEEISFDNTRQFMSMINNRLKDEKYGMSKYKLSLIKSLLNSNRIRY